MFCINKMNQNITSNNINNKNNHKYNKYKKKCTHIKHNLST